MDELRAEVRATGPNERRKPVMPKVVSGSSSALQTYTLCKRPQRPQRPWRPWTGFEHFKQI